MFTHVCVCDRQNECTSNPNCVSVCMCVSEGGGEGVVVVYIGAECAFLGVYGGWWFVVCVCEWACVGVWASAVGRFD